MDLITLEPTACYWNTTSGGAVSSTDSGISVSIVNKSTILYVFDISSTSVKQALKEIDGFTFGLQVDAVIASTRGFSGFSISGSSGTTDPTQAYASTAGDLCANRNINFLLGGPSNTYSYELSNAEIRNFKKYTRNKLYVYLKASINGITKRYALKDFIVILTKSKSNPLHVNNGSAFVESEPYVLNNGVWTPATVYRHDGSAWQQV